jgi:hypothetical protein
VFSVSLGLPEFEVVKQVFLEDCNLLHVEKKYHRRTLYLLWLFDQ